jgi:hypothetical protein
LQLGLGFLGLLGFGFDARHGNGRTAAAGQEAQCESDQDGGPPAETAAAGRTSGVQEPVCVMIAVTRATPSERLSAIVSRA